MGVKVEYLKENITLDNLSEYKLFFLLRKGSLSFLVKKIGSSELIYFKSLPIQDSLESTLDVLMEKDSILSRFEEIEVLAVNVDAHSLIPQRLFDDQSLHAYFEDLFDLNSKALSYVTFSQQDIVMIFAHSSFELGLLKKHFRIGSIKPNIYGLVGSLLESRQEEFFFLHLEQNKMHVCFIREYKIAFLNQFEYSSSADVLYFVLKIMSMFKLDPKKTAISLNGIILKDSEIYKVLFRYVNELNFLDALIPKEINLRKEEMHYFNDIFALSK